MTKEVFYEYMSKVFHPYLVSLGTTFSVILFVDGHTTHQTLQLSKLCVQLGIILIALYPNATRIMQPADVSAFKPLKTGWNKKVGEWRRQNPGEFLTKSKFAPILNTVIQSCIGPETLRNGFRASGLFPCDQNAIDFSKCLGKSSDQPRLATDALKVPDKQLSYERFIQLVGDHKTTQFKNAFNGVCSTALWSDDLMLLYKMFLEFEPKENNEKPIVSTENVLLIETTQFDNTIGSYVDVSLVNPSDGFLYVNEEIEVEEIAESMLNTDLKTASKVPQVIDDYLDWPITPERQGTKPIKPKKPFVITDPLWIKTEENKKN